MLASGSKERYRRRVRSLPFGDPNLGKYEEPGPASGVAGVPRSMSSSLKSAIIRPCRTVHTSQSVGKSISCKIRGLR